MIIPKLALRNLLGAGIRTWLNVVVLSFSFVAIIWTQGYIEGMNQQMAQSKIQSEYAGGQYWQEMYDPFDPLSLLDAHAPVPDAIREMVEQGEAAPVLVIQASIYPDGRMRSILLKGIPPEQDVIALPSRFLQREGDSVPALIGGRMAKSVGLEIGDTFIVQWRDAGGTFDAVDVEIVQIMTTSVQSIDSGQVWIPLDRLRDMAEMKGEASYIVVAQDREDLPEAAGWEFKDLEFLLADVRAIIQSKSVGSSIMYIVLLLLAMLAIFDTQVLSIFRRKKEMGTLMALGFTRLRIIQLFTMEGALNGVLAALVAALYGIPLLGYAARKGWAMPQGVDSFGLAIGEKLFPVFGVGLVIGTTLLVLMVTTIVSYIPTRRIAKLKPTEALRGSST